MTTSGVFSVSNCVIKLSVGKDFLGGGGQIANYADKELDPKSSGFASPTVVI
jgi:hypothetical protein